MDAKHVLLVEDSPETFQLVKQALLGLCDLQWAKSVAEARVIINSAEFQLILLDVNLPDGNGFDFCVELQAEGKIASTPVFFLTGKSELSEKVLGFSAGADDYIVKPFASLELRARVEARLKKLQVLRDQSSVFRWNELEIDSSRQKIWVTADNNQKKEVDLTALEFKLLLLFARNPEKVITRDQILDEIWGNDVHVYSRSVDTHVSKLRKKLAPQSHILQAVHGSGYKMVVT